MTLLRISLAVLLTVALAACGGAPLARRAKTANTTPLYGAPRVMHEQVLTTGQVTEGDADFADAAKSEPEPAAPAPTPAAEPAPPPMPAPAVPGATAANVPKAIQLPPGWQQGASKGPLSSPPPVANDGVESGQMLIYTANLTMAVYQVEHGLAEVERIAKELGGYLAARTDLMITVRVPRAQFDKALKAIEPSGDVVHREIKAEDVTDEFFDLEVRLRNARAMRDRLAKLLQQAAVKEALDIEKELARVTEEIERIEGKLKFFRHRVEYSTINVTFQPRGATVETRPLRLPFSWLDELGLPHLLQLEEH
jgi:hypothetical protein